MAIVNRTPDSFYDRGATYAFDKALDRVGRGGGRRGRDRRHRRREGRARRRGGRRRGDPAHGRFRGPGPRRVPGPGDLGRHLAARGRPGGLPGRRGPAQRCLGRPRSPNWPRWQPSSTSGWSARTPAGSSPRTRPHRIHYDDVVGRRAGCAPPAEAERAVVARRRPERVLIDPGHDFGKNTWHSLELTRRLSRAGGHRLAGAGVAVQQGLRRRGAGSAVGRTAARAPWSPPRSAPGRAPRCSGPTTSPRPGRCWTWWPRSGAAGRRAGGRCGALA